MKERELRAWGWQVPATKARSFRRQGTTWPYLVLLSIVWPALAARNGGLDVSRLWRQGLN